MKIRKGPKPWEMDVMCAKCWEELTAEAEDVRFGSARGVANSFFVVCAICGHRIPIPSSEIPDPIKVGARRVTW